MTKRFVANITIEAETPLKVGCGSSDFLQDSPIQKDFNNLPMILGTSIAGVLRKSFRGEVEEFFGGEKGSRVVISNALLVGVNGKVNETLLTGEKDDFLKIFDILPIREHTAITNKGVTKEHSKFDEEVLYTGSRFKFSIELMGEEADKTSWEELLSILSNSSFRLGGGSTKGFGKVGVVTIKQKMFDMLDEEYIDLSSSLNSDFGEDFTPTQQKENFKKYILKLKPDDFFMFGSGFGDDEADMTPVYEKVVDYENKKLSEKKVLIPASSIKGALAHRTTFHYNKLKELYADSRKELRESISEIFGLKADKDEGYRGKIIFSDIYLDEEKTKVFDHVKIDRFTGGAIDGALFQEKTVASDKAFEVEMLVEDGIEQEFIKAFELALDDVCSGMLPLGGSVNKGHGVFTGEWRCY